MFLKFVLNEVESGLIHVLVIMGLLILAMFVFLIACITLAGIINGFKAYRNGDNDGE